MAHPNMLADCLASGNYSYAEGSSGLGIPVTTTTTSTSALLSFVSGTTSTSFTDYSTGTGVSGYDGTNGYLTAGDCIITTNGTSNISLGSNGYWSSSDRRIAYGKEKDILMDLINMKFKVYCEEKGWIEFDIENFSTNSSNGKKKISLEGSRETSVAELIAERNKRVVIVEKIAKKKDIITYFSLCGTTGTYANGYTLQGTIAAGDYSIAIGSGYVNNTAGYNNTAVGYNTITSGVNNTIGRHTTNTSNAITVNGNLMISGTLTVNGGVTINGRNNVNGACITINK